MLPKSSPARISSNSRRLIFVTSLPLECFFANRVSSTFFFVDVGQSYEGFGGFQTFREQEVAVGAVLVQYLCLRQGLGQNIAAGRIPLDDADADVIFQQLLAQVIGDGAAATMRRCAPAAPAY